jgi:hypothetical protein
MPPIEELLAEVDKWFAEEVQRAPLSYHTECYNQSHAAWQSLRNRLTILVTGEPIQPPASEGGEDEAGVEGPETAEQAEKAPGEADTSTGAKSSKSPKA